MMDDRDQMAFLPDSVSVRHRICCCTLLRGRLTRFIRLRVWVNHGSTLELRTTLTFALGAKAAADAGNNWIGIMDVCSDIRAMVLYGTAESTLRKEQTK
jgi:hypothetical protein